MGILLSLMVFAGIGPFGTPLAYSGSRITDEFVLNLARTSQATSIEKLLGELPVDLKKNFVLVYDSRNVAQHASYDQPRIILFSDDGGFQMSFTGDPGARGGQSIEMISQQGEGQFRFSSMSFEKGVLQHHPNPTTCVQCHGKTPRPIWEDYPLWTGVYGSDHDRLRIADPLLDGRSWDFRFLTQSRESRRMNDFLKRGAVAGRYRFLPDLEAMKYGDLSNQNNHFTDTLIAAKERNLVGRFLKAPELNRFVSLLKYGFYSDVKPPHLGQVSEKEYQEMKSAYNGLYEARLSDFRKEDDRRLDRHRQMEPNIDIEANRRRLRLLGGGNRGPDSRMNDYIADKAAIYETVGAKIGIEPEFWSTGLSKSAIQVGGVSKVDLEMGLLQEILRRDPGLDTAFFASDLKNHRDVLLQKISDPQYRLPRSDFELLFTPVERLLPRIAEESKLDKVRKCIIDFDHFVTGVAGKNI